MKTNYAVALIVAGFALGGLGVQTLHSQPAKMPVFVVNEIEVKDQTGFQKYADANSDMIKKNGGKYLIRGGKVVDKLDGTQPTGRYTVYRFDNMDQLNAWRSDAKDLLAGRAKLGVFRSFIVEGPDQ